MPLYLSSEPAAIKDEVITYFPALTFCNFVHANKNNILYMSSSINDMS